ncbi:hypothetical protein ARHIZOSPH14_32430 [Agromyces rhizosphaerae]|uniref:Transcription regulator PadR N-terminal domain-containing protein n=1 Tax=Agromyces rhizosphaerae TaxID=88374 RepID=A0A9W6CZW0_9MICO|nr:PadR family transcriptional regulator [Agromyces rhizosphaerae]GLI29001.1 hypothetical protein ARHIZOSPH14_32430 [Agromyces rhizosphaerae]
MAVRDALLALLTAGPAYGFQLHNELSRRTGGRRRINVGQTYATLERLTKQSLVESAGATHDGLPLHRLTASGREAARAWLDAEGERDADAWAETVDRVLIALSLPDVDASRTIAREAVWWGAPPGDDGETDASSRPDAAGAALRALADDADADRARAMVAWLDRAAGAASSADVAFPFSAERPRRGRRPVAAGEAPAAQASA